VCGFREFYLQTKCFVLKYFNWSIFSKIAMAILESEKPIEEGIL